MALTKILTEGIKDGEILNVDINASAAIARTKLANVDLVDDTSPQLGGNLDVNTKNIVFGDSSDGSSDDVLSFGAGSDLRLYHDGSNSYIKQVSSGTGNLLIFADGHEIQLIPKSGEPGIKVINDGTVELYYNGTKKFETTSSGVDIAGNCTITGNFRGNDNVKLNLGNGDDLQIYHDGTYNRLAANGQIFLQNKAANETYLAGYENGTVELYYDNSKKFETINTGVRVHGSIGIGTASPNNAIHLKGTDPVIEMEDTAGGDRQGIFVSDAGYLGLYNFTDGRVDMVIDGTGKIGMGTTSPDLPLHVEGTSNADEKKLFRLTNAGGSAGTTAVMEFECGVDEIATISANNAGGDIGNLMFGTASSQGAYPTEKMRITSNGEVGINVNNPQAYDSWARQLVISSSGGHAGMTIRSNSADTGNMYFADGTSGGEKYAGYIQYNHNNSRLAFGTATANRLNIDSEGIKFGSDTATSNGLNDYERGLWTPTVSGGATSPSYGNRRAWYVKIGEFVHASFYITFSAQGDGNQFVLGNLPFTSNYDSPISYNSGGNLSYVDCAFTNNAEQHLYVANNSTNIYFYHNASDPHSPGPTIITTTSVITSSLYGFVAYQTDS